MARKYHQGKYIIKNPNKYVGDVKNIFYRSSWELKAMIRFDTDERFLKWNSEETVIPYISPVDGKAHRYFVDFAVAYKNKKGEIKRALVEVKPLAQTKPPKKKKRMTKSYINEVKTYMVNEAKWKAAEKWCEMKKFEFIKLTEKELNV